MKKMKSNVFALALMGAIAFASCSSDEPNNGGGNESTNATPIAFSDLATNGHPESLSRLSVVFADDASSENRCAAIYSWPASIFYLPYGVNEISVDAEGYPTAESSLTFVGISELNPVYGGAKDYWSAPAAGIKAEQSNGSEVKVTFAEGALPGMNSVMLKFKAADGSAQYLQIIRDLSDQSAENSGVGLLGWMHSGKLDVTLDGKGCEYVTPKAGPLPFGYMAMYKVPANGGKGTVVRLDGTSEKMLFYVESSRFLTYAESVDGNYDTARCGKNHTDADFAKYGNILQQDDKHVSIELPANNSGETRYIFCTFNMEGFGLDFLNYPGWPEGVPQFTNVTVVFEQPSL